MDMSVYSNYSLALATLRFVKRVREENPELWKQIQAEAAQAEQERENAGLNPVHISVAE